MFQYTGQHWVAAIADGLYNYKNRFYHARLGRFLQPDPIGYWDSPNLYAYVLNDPVNLVDPLGLCGWVTYERAGPDGGIIAVATNTCLDAVGSGSLGGAASGNPSFNIGGGSRPPPKPPRRPPECTPGQRAGQAVGQAIAGFGGAIGHLGVGVMSGGVGLGVGGALFGNVPAAALGAIVIVKGGTITAAGTLIAAGGATISALSGLGNEAAAQLLGITLTSKIPSSLGKDSSKRESSQPQGRFYRT